MLNPHVWRISLEIESNWMNTYNALQKIAQNNLLEMKDCLFELAPFYRPANPLVETFDEAPLSMIIGEHPSDYSVSPLMWNAENYLAEKPGFFLPFDIPSSRREDFISLLDYVFAAGKSRFRVLAVTNPYKVDAYLYFQSLQAAHPERIVISGDAAKIGAVNMILIDPDNVFHLFNSDGRGMARAVENYMGGSLAGKKVVILGAGGAARAILHEIAGRVSAAPGGSVVLFNRTLGKARELVEGFASDFPDLPLRAERMENLTAFYEQEASLAVRQDVLISSITAGDPLNDYRVYQALPPRALIVDANYGINSVFSRNAAIAGRSDLNIYDGRGMVVEGYVIPSKLTAQFWGREVPDNVYQRIAGIFGYGVKGDWPASGR